MDEFIFCFVRIVWIGVLILAVLLGLLGVVLLVSPALLFTALRIGSGVLCLAAAGILLVRLFL